MEIPINPQVFHSAAFSPYKPTGFHLHSGAGNALLPCLCAQHHLSPSCSQTEPGREGEEGFSGMIKLPLWRRLRFQLQQLWMQPWRWLCSAAPVVWGPGISGDLLLGGLAAAQKELLQICPLQMCFTGDVKRCKNFFRLLLGNDAGPNHQLVQITEIHKDWLSLLEDLHCCLNSNSAEVIGHFTWAFALGEENWVVWEQWNIDLERHH